MRLKIVICVLIGLYATVVILFAGTVAESTRLLRERVSLLEGHVQALKALEAKSAELCEVKLKTGQVCRAALRDLIRRLGLDDQPESAARTVLKAFDGLGGP